MFRIFTLEAPSAHASSSSSATATGNSPEPEPPATTLSRYRPKSSIVTADEVDRLAHYFHRRRQADVCYRKEAQATLERLSDPAVRHALQSLGALHDRPGNAERVFSPYNSAVSGLALRLRERPGRASAEAALICCQLFISIEVMLGDYRNAIQHFLLGLRVLHQYRSGRDPNFPALDAFAIKLFMSGYPGPRYMMKTAAANTDFVQLCDRCGRARRDLSALSEEVLDLLSGVAETSRGFAQVLYELELKKGGILHALESWEQTYAETAREAMMRGASIPDKALLFGAAFSLLLRRVLKVVVGLAMSASLTDVEALKIDFYTLTEMASFATDMSRAGRGVLLTGPSVLR